MDDDSLNVVCLDGPAGESGGNNMNIVKYNKLVRDKIPQIIENKGGKAVVEKLGDEEYKKLLDAKLQEELEEYIQSGNEHELADIVEVIYALLDYKGISIEEFERIRLDKQSERGAFKERILLREVIED